MWIPTILWETTSYGGRLTKMDPLLYPATYINTNTLCHSVTETRERSKNKAIALVFYDSIVLVNVKLDISVYKRIAFQTHRLNGYNSFLIIQLKTKGDNIQVS